MSFVPLLKFLAIGWSVMAAILYIFQPKFIYYPQQRLESSPVDIGLNHEDVHITTDDGVRLHGWFLPKENAKGVLLFFHGNAGNISHRLDFLRILHDLGLSSFILDYRGYGQSEGRPTEAGTYEDARAAWRYLTETRGISPDNIIIFGRSLGGAIAIWLAQHHPAAGVIVESTFTSISDLASRYYPIFPTKLLTRIHYPNIDRIAKVLCPVLIVHSRDDDIVPYSHGQQLYEAAPEPKRFAEISGGHDDGFLISGTRYTQALGDYIETVLRKEY